MNKKTYNNKEYQKQYYEKNKEEILEKQKKYLIDNKKVRNKWLENNKENKKTYNKKYNENNKETIKEQKKEYQQTEKGKKKTIKANWKRNGLNMENFDEIYKRYTMAIFCDICECVLSDSKPRNNSSKCMDHDHDVGEFRNVVCHLCNSTVCR
tara:strand:+ start:211 stop:669 length:459 start_codon:yes stop_codon:yes gene_type:complete